MVQTILPKTDLTYDDIRDTLNANGGSVTNDVQTAFKPDAKINKWAKYKPTQFQKDFPQDDDLDQYWTAYDGNCGLNIPHAEFTDPLSILKLYFKPDTWKYNLPPGNTIYPFRLTDFGGYDPKAEAPIQTGIIKQDKEEELNLDEDYNKRFVIRITKDGLNSLGLNDFKSLPIAPENLYLDWDIYDYDVSLNQQKAPISSNKSEFPLYQKLPIIDIDFSAPLFRNKHMSVVFYFTQAKTHEFDFNIPYDDNNYFMYRVYTTNKPVLKVNNQAMALMDSGSPTYFSMDTVGNENNFYYSENPINFQLSVTNMSQMIENLVLSNDDENKYSFQLTVKGTVNNKPREKTFACRVASRNEVSSVNKIYLKPGIPQTMYISTDRGVFSSFYDDFKPATLLDMQLQIKSTRSNIWSVVSSFYIRMNTNARTKSTDNKPEEVLQN